MLPLSIGWQATATAPHKRQIDGYVFYRKLGKNMTKEEKNAFVRELCENDQHIEIVWSFKNKETYVYLPIGLDPHEPGAARLSCVSEIEEYDGTVIMGRLVTDKENLYYRKVEVEADSSDDEDMDAWRDAIQVGDKLEALWDKDNVWYKVKVVGLCDTKGVRIHFVGYKKHYDRFLPRTSEQLRR